MPEHVVDIDRLHQYLCGVMDRASHHAGAVAEIALVLAGAIVWRKDETQPIKVMVREGEMKNVLWANIGGKRYAFSYNHASGEIEMREGSIQGDALHKFSNATPLKEVFDIFQSL